MADKLTVADLQKSVKQLKRLAGRPVLIGASDNDETLVQDAQSGPESTQVFMHETIRMMKAERAEKLEKLRAVVGPSSVVIPVQKKKGSFWDHVTVGRASTADIVLDDPAVSNVHAHFEVDEEGIRVKLQDNGSSNGTHLNRDPIQPHSPTPLKSGDCLRFGQSIFYYVGPAMVRDVVEERD